MNLKNIYQIYTMSLVTSNKEEKDEAEKDNTE